MANFIEVKVTYRKTLDNGSSKKVNELYLADAINVKEAEDRVRTSFRNSGISLPPKHQAAALFRQRIRETHLDRSDRTEADVT